MNLQNLRKKIIKNNDIFVIKIGYGSGQEGFLSYDENTNDRYKLEQNIDENPNICIFTYDGDKKSARRYDKVMNIYYMMVQQEITIKNWS